MPGWGPWSTVAYYDDWGGYNKTAHFYNIPTKWISSDGREFWVVFSASGGRTDSFNLVQGRLTLFSDE